MSALSNRIKTLEEILKMCIQNGWSKTVKELEAEIERLRYFEGEVKKFRTSVD